MQSTTAEKTRDVLYSIFASLGFPEKLVSDNGPQFTASAFKNFKVDIHCRIKHKLVLVICTNLEKKLREASCSK